ncbi:MAG: NAD(+) synthase [Eubacteriales bacterium]
MKDGFVKVAAASPAINVADPASNADKIIKTAVRAARDGVKIIVFPELSVTAYTCSDLFLMHTLLCGALDALRRIMKETAELDMLLCVGLPLMRTDKLYNCAAFIKGGRLLGIVPKVNIPNYAEFYEARHFVPAPEENTTIDIFGETVPFGSKLIFTCDTLPELRVAAEICEDLWVAVPPSCGLCEAGATVVLNLSASNEVIGKDDYRRLLVCGQSARLICAYLYSDAGEGESTTDVVFSGHCMIAENGSLLSERKPFEVSEAGYTATEIDVFRLVHERQRMTTWKTSPERGYHTIPFSLELSDTVLSRKTDPHPFVPGENSERAKRCEMIISTQANGLKRRIEAAHAKKCVVAVSGGLDSCLALLVTARAMDLLGRPHSDIITVTMPCFGTTSRTKSNAEVLCTELETDFRSVDIAEAVNLHFRDIGHDPTRLDVVYENVQARERTQIIMDIANASSGIVIGTGDLSELALGWATYNGDHMSMYGVNASIPKTLIRHIVSYFADTFEKQGEGRLASSLRDILDTPVSPELLPAKDGEISQRTEDLVGPYELHDFFLYNMLRFGFSPRKLYRLSESAFGDVYDAKTRLKWLEIFIRRFFAQQFKRSCLPDGPKVGSVAVSPRGDLRMPSDASARAWLDEVEELKKQI